MYPKKLHRLLYGHRKMMILEYLPYVKKLGDRGLYNHISNIIQKIEFTARYMQERYTDLDEHFYVGGEHDTYKVDAWTSGQGDCGHRDEEAERCS